MRPFICSSEIDEYNFHTYCSPALRNCKSSCLTSPDIGIFTNFIRTDYTRAANKSTTLARGNICRRDRSAGRDIT